MKSKPVEISIRGKKVKVPSVSIDGREMIITGKWVKIAAVKDEEWVEDAAIADLESVIARFKEESLRPDLFTFAGKFTEANPVYSYHSEWDNVAAIPITTYADWWEKRLPQVSRKNVRRAQKRGVVVERAPFDDDLVQGITRIYNETPIRQGRRFWHYGKDFETVKRDNSSYLERSDFVVAYYQNEVIGFIKIVYVGKVARIMQILSMNRHFDKRPANAMIAKAVEVCCQRGASHFIYGKYVYGNKANSPVTEFKRRNGFEQILFPVYYIPLTAKGRVSLALKLHLGIRRLVPESLMNFLLAARAKVYGWTLAGSESAAKGEGSGGDEKGADE
jgi:hypothetical protein